MSIILPSKSKNIIPVMVDFIENQEDEDRYIFIEYCTQMKNEYSQNPNGSPQHSKAIDNIFKICSHLGIGSVFPDTFYNCMRAALDKIFIHYVIIDTIRGVDMLN